MNKYDLLEAVGSIDGECLISARESEGHHKKLPIVLGSIAACVCLVLILPIVINLFVGKDMNGGSAPPEGAQEPDKMYLLGTPVTSDRGTITMTEYSIEDKTVTFVFDKTTDDNYGFEFRGYDTENGLVYNILTEYDYISLHPTPENAIITYEGLTYTVNGVKMNDLLFAPGTYEIVVDFGGIYEYCDEVLGRVFVIGFGCFVLGEYETVIK